MPRVVYVLATNRQVPSWLGKLGQRSTPYMAIGGAAVISFALAIPTDVRLLAGLYAFGATLAITIAHLSVLRLRWTQPERARPYRIPFEITIRGRPLPVPTILFQHKVEALTWHERTVGARDLLSKRYLLRQWYRMYAFERSQCRRVDLVIAVSPEDLAWFSVEYGARHVSEIPAGVDVEVFQPSPTAKPEAGHVVFVGAMDRAPNEDAASYLVTAVLPRVRELGRNVTLTIVGRDPTPNVRALGHPDGRVHVTGAVADVRPYLERAAVVAVPHRIGGGTKREIIEAMAMERPIVSTTVGAETLPIRDGEHLLIADTPEQFATAIARLIDEPALGRELGQRAGALARSQFEWSEVAARFAQTCGQLIGARSEASLAAR